MLEPANVFQVLRVDGVWILPGSANWNAHSPRLNFEFNVEGYAGELGYQVEQLVKARLNTSTPLTFEGLEARPLPINPRGVARLFAPYL